MCVCVCTKYTQKRQRQCYSASQPCVIDEREREIERFAMSTRRHVAQLLYFPVLPTTACFLGSATQPTMGELPQRSDGKVLATRLPHETEDSRESDTPHHCNETCVKKVSPVYVFSQPVESSLCLEVQGRGKRHDHEMTHRTYEYQLLCYWKTSRPVARVHLATTAARRLCKGLRATWALQCMADLGHCHLSSCRGCGSYPSDTQCARCATAWCLNCRAWSVLCWKCYRPRFALQDCGEVALGMGGPGGDGSFENPP